MHENLQVTAADRNAFCSFTPTVQRKPSLLKRWRNYFHRQTSVSPQRDLCFTFLNREPLRWCRCENQLQIRQVRLSKGFFRLETSPIPQMTEASPCELAVCTHLWLFILTFLRCFLTPRRQTFERLLPFSSQTCQGSDLWRKAQLRIRSHSFWENLIHIHAAWRKVNPRCSWKNFIYMLEGSRW